ncbi:hypothetical protein [Salipiger aestuarii]|nr:hypothetical protein [Salipiger aestuarii]
MSIFFDTHGDTTEIHRLDVLRRKLREGAGLSPPDGAATLT